MKVASPVLRGGGGGDAIPLPDPHHDNRRKSATSRQIPPHPGKCRVRASCPLVCSRAVRKEVKALLAVIGAFLFLSACGAATSTGAAPATTFVPSGTVLCEGQDVSTTGGDPYTSQGLHVAQSSEISSQKCFNGSTAPFTATRSVEISTAAGSNQGAGLSTP